MRLLAIPALLMLALAGLAVTPQASAAPPAPSCNGTWATTQTVGPVTVFASPPCYEVTVDTMSCPVSPSEYREVRVGSVAVRVQHCGPVEEQSAAAPPCTCPPPPQCHSATTTGPIDAVVSVTLTSDCRVLIDVLTTTVACTEPLDGTWRVSQGRIEVTAPCRPQFDPCEPPFECYPESAALIPPYCRRVEQTVGPVYFDVGQCFAQVIRVDACTDTGLGLHYAVPAPANELVDAEVSHCWPDETAAASSAAAPAIMPVCIWKEAALGTLVKAGVDLCRQDHETYPCFSPQRIHYYEQVGPVYAQVHFCFPHSPPPDLGTAAAESGPCGVQQRCPAPVGLCSGVNDWVNGIELSSGTGDVDLSDNCRATVDVVLPAFTDCTWSGSYKPETVGPVTVWTYSCDPETTSAAAQMPPCTCPPPRPLCYEANRAIAWGDYVQVDDYCNVTVNLEAYCGLQGTNYHTLQVSRVTVNYQTCQQPPVE